MKRYKVGGPTEYSESGSAGGSKVSFGEAFKSARKQGLDEFTWRGKKYTTEMKEEKSDSKADKPSVRKVSTKEFIENYEKSPASGRMRQEAYYKANPEPGLKAVDEEMFSPGVKIAGAAGAGRCGPGPVGLGRAHGLGAHAAQPRALGRAHGQLYG